MSTEEAEFFLLLVSLDRAGTTSLRQHFDGQIQRLLKTRQQVIERLGRKAEIDPEAKGIYYSSWLYSAVHIGCTVEALRTRKALAETLEMPLEVVGKVLDFLEANNLVRKDGNAYFPSESWVRLGNDSPHIIKHHANWRQKAVQHLEQRTEEDLHFSGIYSVDRVTALRVKDKLLESAKTQIKEFEGANEEELYVLGMDFFRLGK